MNQKIYPIRQSIKELQRKSINLGQKKQLQLSSHAYILITYFLLYNIRLMQSAKDFRELPFNQHSNYSDYIHTENPAVLKKNFVFGILVILQQIIVSLIYSFLIQEPPRNIVDPAVFSINYSPIFSAFSAYMFVLVGFGLLFSYNKRLIFSGLGFTLLITCLTVQWYFLINAFWTKVNIGGLGTQFTYDSRFYNIYISNRDGPESVPGGTEIFIQKFRGTLTDAVRCGLANSIAFSAILGRAGLLQCWFVALIGTIGYEFDRYLVENVGLDYGYTFRLFIYAGFMGLMMGLLLRIREKGDNKTTERHLRYTGTLFSGAMALTGVLFLWVFFPMLVMDPPVSTHNMSPITIYTTPICILYGMAGSTLLAISFSYFLNKKLMIRDLTHGSVAGAIAVASAGFYITNPVWAMLVGSVAGIIQAIGNFFERKHSLDKKIITTISFVLFGIQGLVGSIWTGIWRAVITHRNDGLTFDISRLPYPVLQFVAGCIAMGLGVGFGLLLGVIVLLLAKHERGDHFDDYTYWQQDDGIRYGAMAIVPPIAQPGIKQYRSNIKQRHAYL